MSTAKHIPLTLAAALLAGGPVVHAEELLCAGTLGPVMVDNLRVPDNSTCTLSGTRIKGTIEVEEQATLHARGVQVAGNVQAGNARLVSVTDGATVGGSIQIKQGGGATIVRVKVDGDIQLDENSRPLRASGNAVGGSIQVFGNRGGVLIDGNTVDGNLQCKENRPAPTGGGNTVAGNREDQCGGL
jgi:hypothetical protein